MKLKKESIRNLIKAVLFLIVLFLLFLFFTYLFRNTEDSVRGYILSYYEEEEDTMDVVFVGASNVVMYWDGMRAWNEYGFASRNYGTTSLRADGFLYALKDALKTQSPEVLVVEARMFTRYYSDKTEVDTVSRNFYDSLDVGLFRTEAIRYCWQNLNLPWEESLSYFIDIIRYHDNYAALINPKNWELADNRTDSVKYYKGYCLTGAVNIFDNPSENITDECANLNSTVLKLYTDIIEYCQNNDITLMFVATPIVAREDESQKFNTLAQVAESYGVEFVDTNKLYEEMGLDFTQDFYDNHHVNVLGSDKFTDYFAAYLVEKYDLPDRRNESEYASWNELYEEYIVAADKARTKALNAIATNEKALKIEAQMLETNDPMEWLALGDSSEITLLTVADAPCEQELSAESRLALKALGATDDFLAGSGSLKGIYNNKVTYSDSSEKDKKGKLGSEEIEYVLSIGEEPQILLGEHNYYDASRGGIQIVAFDINTNEVFDVVYLSVAEDGSLLMERQDITEYQNITEE